MVTKYICYGLCTGNALSSSYHSWVRADALSFGSAAPRVLSGGFQFPPEAPLWVESLPALAESLLLPMLLPVGPASLSAQDC